MKIKMMTKSAGPNGVRVPGGIYEVVETEAKQLIAGGYAVEVKETPKQEEKKEPPLETAEAKGPRESAEAPEGGRHSARHRR